MNRFKRWENRLGVLAAVCAAGFGTSGTAWAAGRPLFYYVELASFEGGVTTAGMLNEAGQIAGASGSFSTQIGMYPFLSDQSGVLVNLDTLGYTYSDVGALNELGQVAGVGHTWLGGNNWTNSIFRHTPGVGMQSLGKLAGFNGSVAAMNNHGAVVGTWSVNHSTYMPHAFLHTDAGGLQDLGTLGGESSTASDINDAGQVIGWAALAGGEPRAFLWQNGQMTDLGALGGLYSYANAINEAGVIIGDIYAQSRSFGFIYTPQEGMREMPAPEGAAYCHTQLLNEGGMVAGVWVAEGSSQQRIYRYVPGEGSVDLGLPEGSIGVQLTGMNNLGHIVGLSMDAMYESFPFLWTPETGLIDLKPLLSPALDWFQLRPAAINDAGLILINGWDMQSNEKTAVLWPQHPGDLNCDGTVDFFDIDPFIQAVTDPMAHEATFPGCDVRNADVNQDGTVDFFDIDPFLALML